MDLFVSGRYNIGIRLVEEYLAKTRTRGIRSFKTSCENLATKAFPMYMGIKASVENWNEDEQTCVIRIALYSITSLGFSENPLTRFVELPEEMADLQYSGIYCGAIRGAMEMVHVDNLVL